jgi:hypothetical protein
MIPLKAVFVISVLISGLIFTPSFFEIFRQLFSFSSEPSSPVEQFNEAVVVQTSGTSSTTETDPQNILPIADAGFNQTKTESETVTLDGTNSKDFDGNIVSYNWSQINGTSVTLENKTSAITTFVAPPVNATEILEFLLAVVDDSSATDTDSVWITVNPKDDDSGNDVNQPPIADAGFNQTKTESETVTLDGTNSKDSDGNIVSYNWSQINGTSVTLENKTSAIATFVAPPVNATEILEFLLAVVDDSSATDTDSVWITVNPKDDDSDDEPIEDPQDGDDKNKVTICHIPPGNPENAHTITVGESAVVAHIAHGDTLNECPSLDTSEKSDNGKSNSGKGNNNDKGNSGKGNLNDDDDEKSNSGKGNNNDKGNSGKGNQNDDEKSNSGKGNNNEKSNSGKTSLNDYDDRDEDDRDEDDRDEDDRDEDNRDEDNRDEDDKED